MKFKISIIFIETFLEQSIRICKEWVDDVIASQFSNFPQFILFIEMTKIPYFSYEKVKLALYTSTLNKCRIMFALICIWIWGQAFTCTKRGSFSKFYMQIMYMENCEAIRSSTHSFAYVFWKLRNSKFHIFLIFPPIYIKFSLFYSKCFTLSIELT